MPDGEMRPGMEAMPAPEQPASPEKRVESEPQKEAPRMDAPVRVAEAAPAPARTTPVTTPNAAPAAEPKDAIRMKVERVLEENLWDLYFALPKDARERFRAEGERTAAEMRAMIERKRIRPNAVHHAINGWLKTIPKVNPWFLLQEGKIKTDNVMTMVRERRAQDEM